MFATGEGKRQLSLMVLYAISLHYLWAIGLFIDPMAAHATALSVFTGAMGLPAWILPAIFCLVATLAVVALSVEATGLFLSTLLVLPQQAVLMISAYGALHAIWLGQFGDGVQRPHVFILLDQSPAILAAIGHTLAIIGMAQKWKQ